MRKTNCQPFFVLTAVPCRYLAERMALRCVLDSVNEHDSFHKHSEEVFDKSVLGRYSSYTEGLVLFF